MKLSLKEAIESVLAGDAVLFVGSGFSMGAKNSKGEFKSAKELAHYLLDYCGFPPEDYIDDLGSASDVFIEEKGETCLLDIIRDEYFAHEITSDQQFIGGLPWQRIYTTNYDDIIEVARRNNGKSLVSCTLANRVEDYPNKKGLCIHLNGSVSSLTLGSLNNEFKLATRSYLTEDIKKSDWLSLFRTDLKTAKAIFFLGYSMKYDLDIQRIVYGSEELRDKTFFVLSPYEPRTTQIQIKKFGECLTMGISSFVSEIKNVQRTYVPCATTFSSYLCFDTPNIFKTPPTIIDKDVHELYINGDYKNDNYVYYSIIDPESNSLLVKRTKLTSVLNSIENGEKNFLIHSSLGNGKSIFVKELSVLLYKKGYKVFFFRKYYATVYREIEEICKLGDNVVLIFYKYFDSYQYLETLLLHRTNQILILSERSSINELCYDQIQQKFGAFHNICLNKLDDDEIDQLSTIFSKYGLWADFAGTPDYKRFEYIKEQFDSSLCKLILHLLHSPNIIGRYNDVIQNIRNKESYYEAIILILVAHVSGIEIDIDDLVYAIDAEQLNSPSFKRDAIVNEFVDFDGDRIRSRTAIASSVILESVFQADVIVDVLIKVFRRLNEQRFEHSARQKMMRLMMYSNIQAILSKEDKIYSQSLLHFYESIKNLEFCVNNDDFWLQYAIVKLSRQEYQTAKVFFETAYSLAKMNGHDSYKIDNHHARFLLENEIHYGSQSSCMEVFIEAHKILANPVNLNKVRYYPFRVAQNYYPFYVRFFKGMTKDEKNTFINSCQEILRRLQLYCKTTTIEEGRYDVDNARQLLTKILKDQNIEV